jgi:hypothetical protein
MALRIEYFRQGVQVGAVPCPKRPDEAKAAALKGLICHRADLAKILDMDNKSKLVGVVKRKCLRPDVA